MGNNSPSRRRREGREAFEEGVGLDENPYGDGFYGDNWAEGWVRAEKDYFDNEKEKEKEDQLHASIMCEVDDVSDLVRLLIDRGILT